MAAHFSFLLRSCRLPILRHTAQCLSLNQPVGASLLLPLQASPMSTFCIGQSNYCKLLMGDRRNKLLSSMSAPMLAMRRGLQTGGPAKPPHKRAAAAELGLYWVGPILPWKCPEAHLNHKFLCVALISFSPSAGSCSHCHDRLLIRNSTPVQDVLCGT